MKKIVSILASALFLVTMFAVLPVSAAVDKTVNICLGLDAKTAYKLSSDTGRAVTAFDGKLTTGALAASNSTGNNGDPTAWIQCDFGKEHWIDRYVVYPSYNYGGYHFAVTHFQLKVSLDGENRSEEHTSELQSR